MNARGILTAAYQVLNLLPYLGGGDTYLGQVDIYLSHPDLAGGLPTPHPDLARGVPTLPKVGTPSPHGGQTENITESLVLCMRLVTRKSSCMNARGIPPAPHNRPGLCFRG